MCGLILLALGLALRPAAAFAGGAGAAGTAIQLKDLGYADGTVAGVRPQYKATVPGPGRPLERPATLTLVFGHSALLDPSRSTFRVEWNGLPIYAEYLGADSADRTTRQIQIPADRVQPGVNEIRIFFLLVLPKEICEDPGNPARTAAVFRETAIDYGAPLGAPKPDLNLGAFPAAFAREASPAPVAVQVALPADPTPAELSAAAAAVGQISRLAPGTRFTYEAIDATAPPAAPAAHLIAVGTPARNPLAGRVARDLGFVTGGSTFAFPDKRAADPESGFLLLAAAPDRPDRAILAITGPNDDAIARAGRLIGDRRALRTLFGQWAEARTIESAPSPDAGTLTLFPEGLTLDGGGPAEATTPVVIPPLAEGEVLRARLFVARSPNLDLRFSSLKLLVNGEAVAVVSLDGVPQAGVAVPLEVPARFLRPGLNRFTLAGRARPQSGGCDDTAGASAEALLRVAGGAALTLPTGSPGDRISLASWPYPLVGPRERRPTLVAGPDGLTPLLNTAAALAPTIAGDVVAFDALLAGPRDPLPASGRRVLFGSLDGLPYRDALLPRLPLELRGSGWTVRGAALDGAQVSLATPPGVIALVADERGWTVAVTSVEPGQLAVAVRALAAGLPDTTAAIAYGDGADLHVQPLTPPGGQLRASTAPGYRTIEPLNIAAALVALLAMAVCGLIVLGGLRGPS